MAQVVAFNAALTRIGFNAQAVASLNANGLTLVPDLINLNEKDIAQVITRSAELLKIVIDKDAIAEVAGRSRGTPRIANRLLRRVRDYAQVQGSARISLADAMSALEMYEVDELGLDRLDRGVLVALADKFGLPIHAIGVGEQIDDLAPFDPEDFANALVGLDK